MNVKKFSDFHNGIKKKAKMKSFQFNRRTFRRRCTLYQFKFLNFHTKNIMRMKALGLCYFWDHFYQGRDPFYVDTLFMFLRKALGIILNSWYCSVELVLDII